MSIVFHSAPMSSASPVASALVELDVPHELVSYDLSRGDHKTETYRAINPNAKVPTLVVDGTPLFEALAILLWLGDRYGVGKGLWPSPDDPAKLQALSWCTWAYVTYGSPVRQLAHSSADRADASLRSDPRAGMARKQLEELLGLLDERLARQPYLLGEHYGLVDLVVASVVNYSLFFELSLEPHPHVADWLERFRSRRAFTAVMGTPKR